MKNRTLSAAAMSSKASPVNTSDGGSAAVPGTASSNFTLLYIILAVSVGVVLYVALRSGRWVLAQLRQLHQAVPPMAPRLGLSIDDIAALPTFTYRARATSASLLGSDGRRSGGGSSRSSKGRAVECVVCLQELEDGDVVRVLPACRHFFHGGCIDVWLCAHSTCPVCRAHPEPERARPAEAAVSPPLPQLRRCGLSPERPTASRVLVDILARSPLRGSGSTSGSNETIMSKSPSPRVHFGSRSPSPTPVTNGRVDDRWSTSPPPGVSEIMVVRSNSPSPVRLSRELSPRSIGVLESTELIASAPTSPFPFREDGGVLLSNSPSPVAQ
ncbi:hypothetical protein ACP70R_043158 [Stipagrostis hirtigluma subsp. patula]